MGSHQSRRGFALLVLVVAVVWVGAGVAAAQTTGDTSYPTVSTTPKTDPCTEPNLCDPSNSVPQVGGVAASRSLPFSGGDVALLTVLGLAAVGSGTAIVLISRRRRSTSAV